MHNAHKLAGGGSAVPRSSKEPRIQRLPKQYGAPGRPSDQHARMPHPQPQHQHQQQRPMENHANDLARQYDVDQKKIISCCFSKQHEGRLIESYISHVRIIEDAKSTGTRPPPDSPAKYKKARLLIIAARPSGRLRLHKARENSDGTVQIGRTWDLDEITRMEIDPQLPTGFLCVMGKPYYWETNSPRERKVFCRTLLWHYMDYTGGKIPELVNCSVESLGIDPSQVSKVSKNDSAAAAADRSSTRAESRSSQPQSRSAHTPKAPAATERVPEPVRNNNVSSPITTAPLNFSRTNRVSESSEMRDIFPTASIEQGNSLTEEKPTPKLSDREFHAHRRESSLKSLDKLHRRQRSDPPIDSTTQLLKPSKPASSSPTKVRSMVPQQLEYAPEPVTSALSVDHDELDTSTPDTSYIQTTSKLETTTFQPQRPLSVASVEIITHQKTHEEIEDFTGSQEVSGSQDFSYNDLDDLYGDYADDDEEEQGSVGVDDDQVSLVERLQIPTRKTLDAAKGGNVDNTDAMSDIFSNGDENEEVTEFSFLPEGERILNEKTGNGDMVEELLEEIQWSRSDTVDTLEAKLHKILRESQYQSVKSLVDFSVDTSSIESLISSGIHECNILEPILSFFSIELSSFAEDIYHIEKQGRGLQIETTNKKLLWKEIRDLLEAVSISDSSLGILTDNAATYSPRDIPSIKRVEAVLVELDSALQTMRGSANKEQEDRIQMKALQERRDRYEKTAQIFTSNVDLQFKYLMQRTVGSLNVAPLPVTDVEIVLTKELSQLLVFSGITLFLRSSSLSDYNSLLLSYEDQIKEVYSTVTEMLSAHFREGKQMISAPSITFKSDPKDIYGERYRISRNKSFQVRNGLSAENKLKQRLGFSEEPEHVTPKAKEAAFNSIGEGISQLLECFSSSLVNQQDMLVQLFHLSSTQPTSLEDYAATDPVDQRIDTFLNPHRPRVLSMEPDRNVAAESFGSMSQMLNEYTQSVTKIIRSALNENAVEIPRTLAVVEKMITNYSSTNQEFLVRKLTQLKNKLASAWEIFVEKQVALVSESKLESFGHSRSPYGILRSVKVFPEFVRTVEASLSSLDFNIDDLQIREDVTRSYMELWRHLFTVLKGENVMPGADLVKTTTNGSRTAATKSSTFHGDGTSEGDGLNTHIQLLLNFSWLLEETKDSARLGSIKTQLQELSHEETIVYADYIIRSGDTGRLLAFIEGVEGLTKADPSVGVVRSVDPSKRHAYAKDVLKKLLQSFDSKGVDKSVQGIVKQVKKQIMGHSKYSDEQENATSVSVIEDIEKTLVDNVVGVIQNQYSGILSRLNAIVDRYYPDVDVPIDRSEISYSFKRAT